MNIRFLPGIENEIPESVGRLGDIVNEKIL